MITNTDDQRSRSRLSGTDPLRSTTHAGVFRVIAFVQPDCQGTSLPISGLPISGSAARAYDNQVDGLRSVVMPITEAVPSTAVIETSAQGALSGPKAWSPPV